MVIQSPGTETLDATVCERAVNARDARFDGVFFVAITTTRIYCRPACPSRRASSHNRRFFESPAAAECAGFRPCLRCRPELAPGRALIDAVPRLARVAAARIAAGALNGRTVAELARELGVSERHLRRACDRELGISPVELAQTHRLLFAKRLLVDTGLPVTQVAFASGFQSLRRFNAAFLERYRLPPSALRRTNRSRATRAPGTAMLDAPDGGDGHAVRLTLSFRAPFAWGALLAELAADAIPGVDAVADARYHRTVALEGKRGIVTVGLAAPDPRGSLVQKTSLDVEVSAALCPVLMPLLARLRRLLDLDAEPTVIESHLTQGGLGELVRQRRGLRIPGAFDPFEATLRGLLARPGRAATVRRALGEALIGAIGEPFEGGRPGLDRVFPGAERVADAGARRLAAIGIPHAEAETIQQVASAFAARSPGLVRATDGLALHRALVSLDGISDALATRVVMRSTHWPDAFPATDRALQRAAGVADAAHLRDVAERWRPWRAYAALHLWHHGASAA